jgi:hypothetical protein
LHEPVVNRKQRASRRNPAAPPSLPAPAATRGIGWSAFPAARS